MKKRARGRNDRGGPRSARFRKPPFGAERMDWCPSASKRWRPRRNDDNDDALGPSNMEVESRGSRVVAPVALVPAPST